MAIADFSTTLVVDQTPEEVFNAITNVRGWWSDEIEGSTEKLNDEFSYHYKDVHLSNMKLIEVIPHKKVVWLVMDNHFKFTKDKSEWKDNKIIFEITEKDNKTQLQFTQLGLVPEYECYDVCTNAWSHYINDSLHSLIITGQGQPIRKAGPNELEENFVKNWIKQVQQMKKQDYHKSIEVDVTAHEAFESINSVSKWWTENLEGSSQKLNDEFTVQFEDMHFSKQRLIEVIPNEKVVWYVTDSKLSWLKNKQEWTGTKIVFEISNQENRTQLHFTHIGLIPDVECYNDCSNAWSQYIHSLFSLITTGKGQPEKKQKAKLKEQQQM